jgi:hypothetical protein
MSAKCKKTQSNKIISSQKSKYTLSFFGLEIPFGKEEEASYKSTTCIFLNGNDIVLPIGFLRDDYLFCDEKDCTYTDDFAKYVCLLECVSQKRQGFSACDIEKTRYKQSESSGEISVLLELFCVENIAVEIPGETEKN